jgi:phosphoenolpyruvate carboxykinase (ATP)
MPLHPTKYAEMLGKKMEENHVNVWLVNTGWTGGPYGVGNRIKLQYTRAMITAALKGKLENVEYIQHEVFGLHMPTECPDVPAEKLNPKSTWKDSSAYDKKAEELAQLFIDNFKKYEEFANSEILAAAPAIGVE